MTAYIVIPCEHIDIDRMLAGNQCVGDGCPGGKVVELEKTFRFIAERDGVVGYIDEVVADWVEQMLDGAAGVTE